MDAADAFERKTVPDIFLAPNGKRIEMANTITPKDIPALIEHFVDSLKAAHRPDLAERLEVLLKEYWSSLTEFQTEVSGTLQQIASESQGEIDSTLTHEMSSIASLVQQWLEESRRNAVWVVPDPTGPPQPENSQPPLSSWVENRSRPIDEN